MAMANGYGGYGGHGGPADGYHQDHGNVQNGYGSSSNGVGGRSAPAHEQDDAEELCRLHARLIEVDQECLRHQEAANETQKLLQDRAVRRLDTERRVKKMMQEHDEQKKRYREMAREIDEKLTIKDKHVKELTIRNKHTEADLEAALRHRKETVEQIKKREREAIEAEERRGHASSSSGGGGGGGGGSGGERHKASNGVGMGRRTQSTDASSFARRAASSSGTRAGPAEGQRGGRERSNGQPKPFEQIVQSRVEDTLTDFFGL